MSDLPPDAPLLNHHDAISDNRLMKFSASSPLASISEDEDLKECSTPIGGQPETSLEEIVPVADQLDLPHILAHAPSLLHARSSIQMLNARPHQLRKRMPQYHQVVIISNVKTLFSAEEKTVLSGLMRMLHLRTKYMYRRRLVHEVDPNLVAKVEGANYSINDGVFRVQSASGEDLFPVHPASEFFADLQQLNAFVQVGSAASFCRKRLSILKQKFELFETMNWELEEEANRNDSRDFYNISKVDNHLHLAAAMTSIHLLSFIRRKMLHHGDDVVGEHKGQPETLAQLCGRHKLRADCISTDLLETGGGKRMFERFDYFNAAYNPFGLSEFRTLFIKTENHQKGKYFAEISKEVYEFTETTNHGVLLEPRLSIYGRSQSEWTDLANWVMDNQVYGRDVLYLIQVPRIFPIFLKSGLIKNFAGLLENLFAPLFEVTLHPESNPKLAEFLKIVCAFDSVDDESGNDSLLPEKILLPSSSSSDSSSSSASAAAPCIPTPEQWSNHHNPEYSFYSYYLWANLTVLNRLREARGLNTFAFRPHCGESGPIHHLSSAFLLAHGINHGIRLNRSPALTYLYYLSQMGLSISPLSNNTLFLPLKDNPFHDFFKYGMNVTLSTDDPLQFHSTSEPLVEEYTIAKQMLKLTPTDLAEIARNSVLQSGFSHERKQEMLGENYYVPGVEGNNVEKSNIPDCRAHFRHETLKGEIDLVISGSRDVHEHIDFVASFAAESGRSWHSRVFDSLHATHSQHLSAAQLRFIGTPAPQDLVRSNSGLRLPINGGY